MSEFSDSLHIYNDSIENMKNVLEEMEIPSVIVGRNDRTITVLMDWEDKLKVYKKFNILDFMYGEDHGLWLRFYKKREVCKIEIGWDDTEALGLSTEKVEQPVITPGYSSILVDNGFISEAESKKLANTIDEFDKENWDERESLVEKVGELLGLFRFKWLAFDGFIENYEFDQSEYTDAELINL